MVFPCRDDVTEQLAGFRADRDDPVAPRLGHPHGGTGARVGCVHVRFAVDPRGDFPRMEYPRARISHGLHVVRGRFRAGSGERVSKSSRARFRSAQLASRCRIASTSRWPSFRAPSPWVSAAASAEITALTARNTRAASGVSSSGAYFLPISMITTLTSPRRKPQHTHPPGSRARRTRRALRKRKRPGRSPKRTQPRYSCDPAVSGPCPQGSSRASRP